MNIKYHLINMDKYPEKYNKAVKQLNQIGIYNINRKSAVVGKDLAKNRLLELCHPSVFYYLDSDRKLHDQIPSLGGVGCYLSHVELWKSLLEEEDENMVYAIIEDDVKTNCSPEEYTDYINNLPNNWEFIFLGYLRQLNLLDKKKYDRNNYFYPVGDVLFGLHFYLINKSGVRKLSKFLFPITHQIDSYIAYISIYGNLNSYKSKNPLFIQSSGQSSIQHTCISCVLNEYDINHINYTTITIIIVFIVILYFVFRNKF